MFGVRSLIARASVARTAVTTIPPLSAVASSRFGAARRWYSEQPEETYEQFTNRYVQFFENVDDQFELQRGLNNCFSYDLVPDVTICEAALRAARRINDFATGVRVFDAIKAKVDNHKQYEQYLEALKPVKNELGILTTEELGL
ncbi:Cytochrome c oxidase subunit 6 [Mycoemilia scoparia]|uniref:Cytochrome c oxidase subunit 6, mitochondrial n=1 Tax=Mycoemilia scoparia TaxID=417184 RepID=A0A9W8DR21_9FUNG|nr:Cytochrome c oxidase subunit 6 [Mycoemilia scoparia]